MQERLKTAAEARRTAAAILKQHNVTIERLKRDILRADEDIKNAQLNEVLAQENNYKRGEYKARQDITEASQRRTDLEAQLAQAQKEILIPEEEYKLLCDQIRAEVDSIAEEYKADFLKISDKLFDMSVSLLDIINEAEQTMKVLQHDLYRDTDRPRNDRGLLIPLEGEQRVNPECWTIAEYGRVMAMSHYYKQYTGEYRK